MPSPRPPKRLLLLLLCFAPFARAQTPAPAEPADRTVGFVFEADYLLWKLKRGTVSQTLAVTTDADPTAGGPFNTIPVFGNQKFGDDELRSGLRLRASLAATDTWGVEVGGFLVERAVFRFSADPASSLGSDVLARPVVDADTGVQGLAVLNLGQGDRGTGLAGSLTVASSTKLYGGEASAVARAGFGGVEAFFAGYRYLALREQFVVSDRTTVQTGGLGFFGGQPMNEDDTAARTDTFRARNDFHGANVGLRAAARSGAFDLTLRPSVAVGVVEQRLEVSGTTALQTQGLTTAVLPGGLLALPSNIGSRSVTTFAVVPEVDVSVGYQVAPWARLSVGYNFLYISSVVRPSEQLDRTTTLTQLPTAPAFDATVPATSPRAVFNRSDFWAQGLTFGVSVVY